MSGNRRDLHKAKLRRDRIRREKHAQRAASSPRDPAPPPVMAHPFATERAMREMQALMEGQEFENIEDANAHIAKLTESGRLSEAANAWKRDDPKWRAQELAYDALETDDPGEALYLIDEALKFDPDCIDALRLKAALTPAPLPARILLMRDVVAKAEQKMDEGFLQEYTGHFWQRISTRPYMRAMQSLAELLAQGGDVAGAIAVFERALELNPHDNQGMRFPLLGLYLSTGQAEAAGRVLARYPDEEKILGSIAWARVLQLWLSSDLAEAEAALARARKVNPFVEEYLLGRRKIPEQAPAYFKPGDISDAQVCAGEQAIAWKSNPGFRKWVGKSK